VGWLVLRGDNCGPVEPRNPQNPYFEIEISRYTGAFTYKTTCFSNNKKNKKKFWARGKNIFLKVLYVPVPTRYRECYIRHISPHHAARRHQPPSRPTRPPFRGLLPTFLKQIGPIVDKKPVQRQLDGYEEEEIRTDSDLILIGQCEATLVWGPETGKSSDQDK
jgi:hypothetical protein